MKDALPINAILLYEQAGVCSQHLGYAQKPGYVLILHHRDAPGTQSIVWLPCDYATAKAVVEKLADGTPVEYMGGEKCTMFWIGSSSDSSSPSGSLSLRAPRESIIAE